MTFICRQGGHEEELDREEVFAPVRLGNRNIAKNGKDQSMWMVTRVPYSYRPSDRVIENVEKTVQFS